MLEEKDLEGTTLTTWVCGKVAEWQEHYDANYLEKHKEYDRIWRGIWDANDKTRESERSRLISPASSQAVESSVAEVEEAVFGRGEPIDIRDDAGDASPQDIAVMRKQLLEDFKTRRFRRACGEVLITAAVTGTGCMELVLDEVREVVPATQPIDGQTQAVGTRFEDRVVIEYRPVHPRNIRVDPAADSIEHSMGVAIDEYVPVHQVEQLQEKGVYRDDVVVGTMQVDTNLQASQELTQQPRFQCHLIKYYGLVPSSLLNADEDEPGEDPLDGFDFEKPEMDDDIYVEAIVVIDKSSGNLLKAERNPFMMNKRPIVAFQWDIVPGRFWGRGVIEKGYNSQKAIDAELRARADALALTAAPMLAVDGTRMPRGMNAKIVPGKTLITSGNPREVLQPFNFGEVSQITFAQAESLQNMLQQATGAVDTAGLPSQIGEARSGAVSMSLGGVMKRHKRTLVHFQDDFLIPVVERAAWMLIQYDPDRFPAKDYKFVVSASLGVMAREYETSNLSQILNSTPKDSPAYVPLLEAVLNNMHVSNREELIAKIQQASQPTPEQIQAQQAQAQAQQELLAAQTAAFQAQANESNKRAEKYEYEKRAIPVELENERIKVLSQMVTEEDLDEKEFERRLRFAEMVLREREVDLKEIQTTGVANRDNPTGVTNGTSNQTRGLGASLSPNQRPI